MGFSNLIEVLNRYGREIAAHSKNNLEFENKIASGDLYNSIRYIVEENDNAYEIDIELEDYWKYVNDGRKAGGKFPPINKIEEWIRKKPIIPYRGRSGKLPSIEQLTFLISRKIAKDGIAPSHFMDKAVEVSMKDFEKDVQNALSADIGNELKSEIKILYNK